jgi:hypothetical protein
LTTFLGLAETLDFPPPRSEEEGRKLIMATLQVSCTSARKPKQGHRVE